MTTSRPQLASGGTVIFPVLTARQHRGNRALRRYRREYEVPYVFSSAILRRPRAGIHRRISPPNFYFFSFQPLLLLDCRAPLSPKAFALSPEAPLSTRSLPTSDLFPTSLPTPSIAPPQNPHLRLLRPDVCRTQTLETTRPRWITAMASSKAFLQI